jgi:general secretion pathway protein G
MSLIEVLAAVSVLGFLAAIALPRFLGNSAAAKRSACYTLKGNIEVQSQLWFRNKGTWPASNLSDIGADATYFPEGLSQCPVDGSAYSLDAATHRVSGHTH